MRSISSVKSLPSMPIWCTPMASTPANAPGPTTLMKMIAYTSSGNARSTSSTNLPTRGTTGFFHRLREARSVNGTARTVPMVVPKKPMPTVSSIRWKISSELPV